MSNVFRYINNSSSPITAGGVTVPPYDQVMLNEENKDLSDLVPKFLNGLKNGTLINQPEDIQEIHKETLELHVPISTEPTVSVVKPTIVEDKEV